MINSQREVGFAARGALAVLATSLANGKLISAKSVLGPKVARTDTVGSSEQPGRFLGTKRGQISAVFVHLVGFAQCHPDVARQRVVTGQCLIRSLQNDHVLLTSQRVDDRR